MKEIMWRYRNLAIILLVLLSLSLSVPRYKEEDTEKAVKVVDHFTKKPIKDAIVTFNDDVFLTDENGIITIKGTVNKVAVRAYGYLKTERIITASLIITPIQIELIPFTPKALYLSFYGIGDKTLRGSAVRLIEETELNALVIDVKGDRGGIIYNSSIPLASEIGA